MVVEDLDYCSGQTVYQIPLIVASSHVFQQLYTFHLVTPGIHFNPGRSTDASANSNAPGDRQRGRQRQLSPVCVCVCDTVFVCACMRVLPSLFSSSVAMTASSSIGLSEQVE